MQGERFVQLLEQQSLDALLSKVAAAHPAVTLSILLEGLHSYLRQVLKHLQGNPVLSLAPSGTHTPGGGGDVPHPIITAEDTGNLGLKGVRF